MAVVLGLASCQTEPEGLDVQMGGEVDATITVSIPDSETRAGGNNSALGVFDNGILGADDVTMRYILQVYYGETASQERLVKYSDDKEVNFDVRLVPGRAYKFVAWADVVEGNDFQENVWKNEDGLHYNTADLKNITLKETWVAMDETRDAFTDVKEVTNFNAASVINLTLKRPFAKLRVKTTDVQEMAYIRVTPAYATVEYTTPYRAAFNAFEGHAIDAGTDEKTHTKFAIANYGDNNTNNKILFTDYFFAEEGDAVSFILDVYEDEAMQKRIKSNNFNTDIAVNRNYLTTIQGNILTDGNNIEVKVEDAFANADSTDPNYEYTTISSADEFIDALTKTGQYIVISDIRVNSDLIKAGTTVNNGQPGLLSTRAGGNTTLIDLNGNKITIENKENTALATVAANTTLVITDTDSERRGKIELAEGSNGAFIENNGTVVIENGNIESNSTNDAPVIENNGTTNITGGVIGDNVVENNETEGGSVNITGGTFTSDELLNDYVNDDYQAIEGENGEVTIEKKPTIAMIGDNEYTSIKKAVEAAKNGDTITFIADVEQVDGVLITDKNLTIDLNGKTYTITEGANTNNRNFKVNGSSVVTIKNGTMVAEGELTSGAYGTVRTEGTAVVNLESVQLYSYRGYGLNVKACTGTTIKIKDSEIYAQYSGGVEAAGGNIELTNVKIDQKGVYSNGAWCSVAIGVNVGGNVTVNSGNYSASAINTDANAAQGTWVAYVMSSGGTLNIKGGTFNGVVAETASATNACGLICADTKAIVNIYGGTFSSNGAILDMRNNTGGTPNPSATLYAGTFSADPRVSGLYSSNLIKVDSKSDIKEENGKWVVFVRPVAKIGEVEYETLEAAIAAAKAGNTITLIEDVTLSSEVTLPAGITLNGNGKQINGTIYAGGNLTFAGHTKVTAFSASYYDRVITIGEGACLEITGGGRVTLGYGNTFNITGSVENAKTADKANIQPSLIIPAGISITGGSDATMNVTNAYVKIGSTSSKNSAANGEFTLNFTNSIAEFTNQLTFAEPTSGKNPTFNLNIVNSVLTTGTKLIFAAPKCKTVIDNSNVTMATYFRNSGSLEVKNGSVVTGSTIQFGENGGNDGKTIVDNSTFTITASSAGHALDGKGTGSITANNGATVNVDYYKGMTIKVDATSTFTGTEVQ